MILRCARGRYSIVALATMRHCPCPAQADYTFQWYADPNEAPNVEEICAGHFARHYGPATAFARNFIFELVGEASGARQYAADGRWA